MIPFSPKCVICSHITTGRQSSASTQKRHLSESTAEAHPDKILGEQCVTFIWISL